MADLALWLTACLDEDERIARATLWDDDSSLGSGRWIAYDRGPRDGFREARWVVIDGADEGVVDSRPQAADDEAVTRHIAEHDPARVLREIEAKRQLLADVLGEPHFRNEEDNWYSCAALTDADGDPVCMDDSRAPGPCDCGRDARVVRRLRLLALPYEHRPGYKEATNV